MSREIPFFELFAQLQLSLELRLKLLGAVIASAYQKWRKAPLYLRHDRRRERFFRPKDNRRKL